MKQVTIKKAAPVIGEYDVVVCGGGPSGVMAAVGAARQGTSVALIERYGFLGGMATAGLVAPISQFCYNNEVVIGGIPWEFASRLAKMGGAKIEYPLGSLSFDPESYKLLMQRMLLEANVRLYLHAFLTDCIANEEHRITHAIIESKSGAQALAGRVFIDCTGDGDLACRAQAPMQEASMPLQPASLCFCIDGIETEKIDKIHHSQQGVNYHHEALQQKLRVLSGTQDVPNFGGPWFCYMMRENMLLVNMTRRDANMADEQEITQAECTLREDAFALVELLRAHGEEFRNARILFTAPQVGVRETRRVRGAHILTGQEYLAGVHFEDAIGRGAHPIDIHAADSSTQRCEFLKQAAYIPYRSLVIDTFPNLLVPGRSFSADREASASARVQGCMMGLGQAAGFAAAQCAKECRDVGRVDIRRLRGALLDVGANI